VGDLGNTEGTRAPAADPSAPRPWVKAGELASGRRVLGLSVLALTGLALSAAAMGFNVFAVAALVALLPLPLYLGVALWADRYEPEPKSMLATAFLWGASVAVLSAGLLNSAADALLGSGFSTVVVAPVGEELAKGIILFWFYSRRRDEFDGVIDGLIYAAMVGLGFAFAENIDYYGNALAANGQQGLAVVFTLRGILGPFSHPLFTAMTGLSLGIARQTTRPWIRRLAPLVGLAAAMALHSAWNASTTLGCVFFAVYVLVMIPALIAVAVMAVSALRGESRIIRAQLVDEAGRGVIETHDLDRLCNVRGRLDASVHAWFQGGRTGWRQRRAWHRAATELAFLRHRVSRGTQPPDPELEAAYLQILSVPFVQDANAVIVETPPPQA
jgi:RsiW-degrading membrane proteinase PrsW (M82 family)